ncbi:hypothetical protein ACFL4P_00720 [Gemmatimonadota bacterium]
MKEFSDLLTHLEQKLSYIKIASDLLYAKMGESADGLERDAIIHFRAGELENLLITLENFVEEQDKLIKDFIDSQRVNKLEQVKP